MPGQGQCTILRASVFRFVARLRDQLVSSIVFSTLEVGEGHRVLGPESATLDHHSFTLPPP